MRVRVGRALRAAAAGVLILSASCAKAPNTAGGGTRLLVTMRFAEPVRDIYHYFFVIRNAGDDIGRNGPVPVLDPPYAGNGFAFGSSQADTTAPFTDFVEYNRSNQPSISSSGYTVYHVPGGIAGDPTNNFFTPRGNPVTYVAPNNTTLLQFELDLNQIAPATGETAPNPDNRPRYLQVNFIATTTTPANHPNFDPDYVVDAIGDQRLGSGSFNTFITIDTSQIGKVYASNQSPGPPEPQGDPYPSDRDPAVDMVFWSVQITR